MNKREIQDLIDQNIKYAISEHERREKHGPEEFTYDHGPLGSSRSIPIYLLIRIILDHLGLEIAYHPSETVLKNKGDKE